MSLSSQDQRFEALEKEIEKFSFTFPILDKLQDYLKEYGKLNGARIGWHCHLTVITAASANVLLNTGASLIMSECNPATSDSLSIEYMEKLGATIYRGAGSARKVLDARPLVISDTGFVLIDEYLRSLSESADASPGARASRPLLATENDSKSDRYVIGACEITSSGIQKLRRSDLGDLPVININDGELKTYIENFHGVGDGVIDSLSKVTGRMWSGRHCAVAGYGRVGAGVAAHLRSIGAVVSVVENDPARKLIAHYDGFTLCDLSYALASCELLVTATGRHWLIGVDEIRHAREGLILMNVGHWPEEIAYEQMKSEALSCRQTGAFLEELEFSFNGEPRKILLLGGAGPANVVMCSGSIEPTLIHLVTEILCMDYLVGLAARESNSNSAVLPGGEISLPKHIQDQASLLALKALHLA